MMQRFEVKREAPERLTMRLWTFGCYETAANLCVYLDTFTIWERPTTRHKYRCVSGWETRRNPWSNLLLTRNDVPTPKDVVDEAYNVVIHRVQMYVGHPNIEGENGGVKWKGWPE